MSMDASVVFSGHVINSVKALPESDRRAIANALAGEFLLGLNPDDELTPFQSMLYTIMQFHIKRDSTRAQSPSNPSSTALVS